MQEIGNLILDKRLETFLHISQIRFKMVKTISIHA